MGASRAKMDFQYDRWFTPSGHYIQTYLDIRDEYFRGANFPVSVYTKEPVEPNTYFTLQDELHDIFQALVDEEYVSNV